MKLLLCMTRKKVTKERKEKKNEEKGKKKRLNIQNFSHITFYNSNVIQMLEIPKSYFKLYCTFYWKKYCKT